jgi:hypothetical protein
MSERGLAGEAGRRDPGQRCTWIALTDDGTRGPAGAGATLEPRAVAANRGGGNHWAYHLSNDHERIHP